MPRRMKSLPVDYKKRYKKQLVRLTPEERKRFATGKKTGENTKKTTVRTYGNKSASRESAADLLKKTLSRKSKVSGVAEEGKVGISDLAKQKDNAKHMSGEAKKAISGLKKEGNKSLESATIVAQERKKRAAALAKRTKAAAAKKKAAAEAKKRTAKKKKASDMK